MEWKVWSKTWGLLVAPYVTVGATMITMSKVTRDGKPFQSECMIPIHDVTMVVKPEEK